MGAPLTIRLTVDIKCGIIFRVYGKGYSQWFVILASPSTGGHVLTRLLQETVIPLVFHAGPHDT